MFYFKLKWKKTSVDKPTVYIVQLSNCFLHVFNTSPNKHHAEKSIFPFCCSYEKLHVELELCDGFHNERGESVSFPTIDFFFHFNVQFYLQVLMQYLL